MSDERLKPCPFCGIIILGGEKTMKRRVKPRRTDMENHFAEWVDRLLKLDLRDRFKNGFCVYCQSLCSPRERAQGICPNCRSMRKAMREAIDAAMDAERRIK